MFKISKLDWRTGTLTKVGPAVKPGGKSRLGPVATILFMELIVFLFVLFVHVKCAYVPPKLSFDQKRLEAKIKGKYIKDSLKRVQLVAPRSSPSAYDTGYLDHGDEADELRKMDESVLDCRGVAAPNSSWVNYLVLAPPHASIDPFKQLLQSIWTDKDVTRLCGVRVCIAFGGDSDEKEIVEVSRAWSKKSLIEIFFIPTYSHSPRVRLHESVTWLAHFWKRDIVYVIEPSVVVPHGFSEIIRDSTKSGKAVFMPHFLESKTNDWNEKSAEMLENVGVYVSDAINMELYSASLMTPLFSSNKSNLKVNEHRVYGLVKM